MGVRYTRSVPHGTGPGKISHSRNRLLLKMGGSPTFGKNHIPTNHFFRLEKYYLPLNTSVEHPQTNGLAEAANKVILHALKKKLDDAKGLWAELIPEVLWGYNTTPQSSTKETPFRLVYGSEAMIPLEISQSSIRTQLGNQEDARRSELDIIEEIRDIATLRQSAAQHALARQYNKMVKSKSFVKGDLILRKTDTARKPPSHGKLAANWDGPYRKAEVLGNGAYKLESIEGKILPNTWNVSSLKKFYS
ncbi:uncharacterized protein LOC130949519 [Arachis stenosperma]|uniref:uncharacterized protein LOC130949519 n=1 Tax=Arachis stenosperma TaxID=217475 RepID=UPI0025AB6013|nr:uncharacterized protein LOC130949519 [Arachis stenosperma]